MGEGSADASGEKTLMDLLLRNEWIQALAESEKWAADLRCWQSIWWLTRSKAAERSRRRRRASFPLSFSDSI